jgi:hypothetical protein
MIASIALAVLLMAGTPSGEAGFTARPKRPPATRNAPAAQPAPVAPPATGDVVRPQATPSARPAHRGAGAVVYVTAAGRAYLDAGSEDGLAAGAEIVLRRGAAVQGKCTVEAVAPHHAVCTAPPGAPDRRAASPPVSQLGGRVRVGDSFDLPAVPEPAPPPVLPPPPAPEVMARRLAVVEAAPQAQVAFQGSEKPETLIMPRTRAIDVSLEHQTWDASPGGTSTKDSLDVIARGVPLSSWLFLDLDARVEHWSARQNPRFRPNDDTQVYVWQAELTAVPNDAVSISAGRVLPWGIPGATIFDGGMVGWHGLLSGTRTEAGLFGGTVPQPDTLKLTGERATGGAYWIVDGQLAGGVFRTEGRLAAARTPELGTRGEGSLTARYFVRLLDLSAEANLGAGGKEHAEGYLDSARLDATLRPVTGLSVGGSFRYSGLAWPQTFDPPAFPGHSREADGFLAWDATRWLRLGGTAGTAEDLESNLHRTWLGPELAFPRVLGGWATFSFGYLEESGWIEGRSAYGQLVATPWKPIWLLARASWSHESTQGPSQDEGALTLGGRAQLNQWLALRLTVSGRTVLDAAGEAVDRPTGLTAFGTLQASF